MKIPSAHGEPQGSFHRSRVQVRVLLRPLWQWLHEQKKRVDCGTRTKRRCSIPSAATRLYTSAILAYSGKFQYIEGTGTASQSGPSRLTIEEANLRLVSERGNATAFGLGDIDVFLPGDYELSLKFYTGRNTPFAALRQSLPEPRS